MILPICILTFSCLGLANFHIAQPAQQLGCFKIYFTYKAHSNWQANFTSCLPAVRWHIYGYRLQSWFFDLSQSTWHSVAGYHYSLFVQDLLEILPNRPTDTFRRFMESIDEKYPEIVHALNSTKTSLSKNKTLKTLGKFTLFTFSCRYRAACKWRRTEWMDYNREIHSSRRSIANI